MLRECFSTTKNVLHQNIYRERALYVSIYRQSAVRSPCVCGLRAINSCCPYISRHNDEQDRYCACTRRQNGRVLADCHRSQRKAGERDIGLKGDLPLKPETWSLCMLRPFLSINAHCAPRVYPKLLEIFSDGNTSPKFIPCEI